MGIWDFLSSDTPEDQGIPSFDAQASYDSPLSNLSLDTPPLTLDSVPSRVSPTIYSGGETQQAPLEAFNFDTAGNDDSLHAVMAQNSSAINGLNADIAKLKGERESLYGSSEKNWGILGAGLLSGIGTALGGGTTGDIATSASAAGTGYYNNLAADEKAKLARYDTELGYKNQQLNIQTQFGNTLATDKAKGEFIGTPENLQKENLLADRRAEERLLAREKLAESVRSHDISANQRDRNLDQRDTQLADINNRYKQSRDDRVAISNKLGTMVSSMEPETPLDTATKNKITDVESHVSPILKSLADLKQSVAQYGNVNLGTIDYAQRQALARYVLNAKMFYGEGANFTLNEERLNRSLLGASISGAAPVDAIFQDMTGADLSQLIDNTMASFLSDFSAKMNANGAYVDPSKLTKTDPNLANLISSIASNSGITLGGPTDPNLGKTAVKTPSGETPLDKLKAKIAANPALKAQLLQKLGGG